jgi:hypothetical protein
MATWDVRQWLASQMGCGRDELEIRSTDRYGERETQVRYDRGGESVARVIVTGPFREMGQREGAGHWLVSAQVGWDAKGSYAVKVPELEEIVY